MKTENTIARVAKSEERFAILNYLINYLINFCKLFPSLKRVHLQLPSVFLMKSNFKVKTSSPISLNSRSNYFLFEVKKVFLHQFFLEFVIKSINSV